MVIQLARRTLVPFAQTLAAPAHRSLGAAAAMKTSQSAPGVVIFDKDGTLVCFHSMWSPWVEDLASRLHRYTGKDLMPLIAQTMGYDQSTKRIVGDSALLAHATMPIVREKLTEALLREGMPERVVNAAMLECWEDCSTQERDTIVPLFDVKALFEELKDRRVKTAICTADSRSGCEGAVDELGVGHLVDIMVCGDDEGAVPKPAPNNALRICQELNVYPTDSVMVGDTTADVGMGYTAGMGAAVGVLSGIGSHSDLSRADYLVPDASKVLDVTVHMKQEWRRRALPAPWEFQKGHSLSLLHNISTSNVQSKDQVHSPYQTRN